MRLRVRVGRSCAWLAFLASACWLSVAGGSAGQATAQRAQPTAPTATVTFFGSATPRMRAVGVRRAAELGVVFRSSRAGEIVGIRFFKGPGNHGKHSGTLWSSSGRKLAKATFTDETASGWQSVRFATPVAIKAHTTYIASYHSSRGRFARMGTGFRTRKVSGPLIAIGSRYAYGPGTRFPNRSDRRAVYYVDVMFAPTSAAAPVGLPSPDGARRLAEPPPRPSACRAPTPAADEARRPDPPSPTATPTVIPTRDAHGDAFTAAGGRLAAVGSAVVRDRRGERHHGLRRRIEPGERQQRLRDRQRRRCGPQRRLVDFVRRRVPGDRRRSGRIGDPLPQRGRRPEHQGACQRHRPVRLAEHHGRTVASRRRRSTPAASVPRLSIFATSSTAATTASSATTTSAG